MKRLLQLAVLLLLCRGLHASNISRDGACVAATTNCTFSATATGSLKLIFAFHSGSTTIPTLPSGWTSIDSIATASGGTPGALRIGCNVSSSSNDTGSGTWTNATAVTGISYSGTNAGTTANCNTTGVGGEAHSGAKTTTTASFPALTLLGASGSWVAGFLGDSASSVCTPSGMTQMAAATSGTVEGNDTSAAVTSWSGQNCTVSSSTYLSAVAEILAHTVAYTGIAADGEPAGDLAARMLAAARVASDRPTAGDSGGRLATFSRAVRDAFPAGGDFIARGAAYARSLWDTGGIAESEIRNLRLGRVSNDGNPGQGDLAGRALNATRSFAESAADTMLGFDAAQRLDAASRSAEESTPPPLDFSVGFRWSGSQSRRNSGRVQGDSLSGQGSVTNERIPAPDTTGEAR